MLSRVQARNLKSSYCFLLTFWSSHEHFSSFGLITLDLSHLQEIVVPGEGTSCGIQHQ